MRSQGHQLFILADVLTTSQMLKDPSQEEMRSMTQTSYILCIEM